jgi:hypothetical protein
MNLSDEIHDIWKNPNNGEQLNYFITDYLPKVQQLEKLNEYIIFTCNTAIKENKKLKKQNEKMLNVLIKINECTQISDDRFAQYSDTIHIWTNNIINEITKENNK